MVLPFYNISEVFDFAFIDGGDEAHRIPVPFPFSPVVFLAPVDFKGAVDLLDEQQSDHLMVKIMRKKLRFSSAALTLRDASFL